MRKEFIKALINKADKDEKIILIVGDLGYSVVEPFKNRFPNRFLNFGINEQAMISAAAGLANHGFKPFVYSIGNFPTFRALEQLRNDVCAHDFEVNVVSVGAGFGYAQAGYSHHAVEDVSIMSIFTNLTILNPANLNELDQCFKEVDNIHGPKYWRLAKSVENSQFDSAIDSNVNSILEKTLFVVSTGAITNLIRKCLLELENSVVVRHLSVPIINEFEISKLSETLKSKHVLTIEEHIIRGGFGSYIFECIGPVIKNLKCYGIKKIRKDISGSEEYLRRIHGLDGDAIKEKILEFSKEIC